MDKNLASLSTFGTDFCVRSCLLTEMYSLAALDRLMYVLSCLLEKELLKNVHNFGVRKATVRKRRETCETVIGKQT